MLSDMLPQALALIQVVLIDLVLAGDNAVVVGLAASAVAPEQRARVVFWGVAAAVVMRICLALVTTQLLGIIGLKLAGGLLLLWVAYKMYRELSHGTQGDAGAEGSQPPKTFLTAMLQILVADLSMSLDNVLAVAGAARDHLAVLVIGLLLSVGLMGAVASFIASKMAQYRWTAWAGLAVIVYVAGEMIFYGTGEVSCAGLSSYLCEVLPGGG